MAVLIDTYELAWAAGFYDGEGCTGLQRHGQVILQVGQSGDPAVLYRFQRAVGGLGAVRGPYKQPGSRQPRFVWHLNRFEAAQAVIAMLWPRLSEPKRGQAARTLLDARAHRAGAPERRLAAYGLEWRQRIGEGNRRAWERRRVSRAP